MFFLQGHYAIMFAKALGAEVYASSSTDSKEQDCKKMGADHFVHTEKSGFAEPYKMKLDLIIITRNVAAGYPLEEYLSSVSILFTPRGTVSHSVTSLKYIYVCVCL